MITYGIEEVLMAMADIFVGWGKQALDSVDENESPNEEAAANWDLASDRLREAARYATAALKHEGRL
jgi:hypothetical protein